MSVEQLKLSLYNSLLQKDFKTFSDNDIELIYHLSLDPEVQYILNNTEE